MHQDDIPMKTEQIILDMGSLKTPLSFYKNMIWRPNLHQSFSLAEAQKALETHDCKFSVTSSFTAPHTLGILTANVTCCIHFL